MDNQAAAKMIEAMVQSIKDHPNQFVIQLKVIGQAVSVTNGGIGQINSARGGAAGSTTIANKVVADGSSVEIARGRANDAMNEQMAALVASLGNVAQQLRSEKPDKGVIKGVLDSLAGSWVPPLIAAVISSLPAVFG